MKHEQHHDEGIVERKMLSKSRIVLIGFLLVIGYFLFTEHRAHVIAFLPYLLLLACPLMHLFMHGGHGEHGHGDASTKNEKADS
jgi:Protein of unknown function (DUF2933)